MDTKFKNQDLLIKALDKCILCYYHISAMITIKHMIINNNVTFEQALCAYKTLYSKETIYHIISKLYHQYITELNNNKLKTKHKEENHENV